LTAVPNTGYVFDKWVGGPCNESTENVCIFSIDQTYSIVANFKIPSYTVTIINVGDGAGRTYSDPIGIDCIPNKSSSICSYEFLSGTLVTIYADSSAGSNYFGLSSYQVGNTVSNSLSFILSENVVISANYVGEVYYNFTLEKTGPNVARFFTLPFGINCGTSCTNAVTSFLENTTIILDVEITPNRQLLYYNSTRPVRYRYVAGDGIDLTGDGIMNSGEFFTFDGSFVVTNNNEGVPYVQDDNNSLIIAYKDVEVDMTGDITINPIIV
jgi:hypothetical protein